MPDFWQQFIQGVQQGRAMKKDRDDKDYEKQKRDFEIAKLKHQQGGLKLENQAAEIAALLNQRKLADIEFEAMQGQPGQVVPDEDPLGGTKVLPHAPVQYPGSEALGRPAFSRTPQTAQELLHQQRMAQIQAQQAEAQKPYTLNP